MKRLTLAAGARAAPLLLGLAAAATLVGGCTSRELYQSGQQWQRTECRKLQDMGERNRCERSAAQSYEDYRKEADAATKPKSAP